MVNAGRVLIIPKGQWSGLENYVMLDLVSKGGIAYLARQASVNVDPTTDLTYTYWQPFGAATLPDGTTIKYNENNEFEVNIDGRTLVYDANSDYIKVAIDGNTIKYDSTNGYIYADVTSDLAGLTDVTITSAANNQVLVYNSTSGKWVNATLTAAVVTYSNTTSGLTATNIQGAIDENALDIKNKHKVTNILVDITSGWTQDIISQSGTTLYKKQVSLNHVYTASPTVEIGAASGSVLPTTAQQEAYDLVLYATSDDTVPCLYLYASDIPQTAFYINVEGVD